MGEGGGIDRVMQSTVEIPYTPDESRITITQHRDTFWLSMGSLHGPGDVTVEFDSIRYEDGVLFFSRDTAAGEITTAHINWHLLDAGGQWGDVDEWLLDQIELDGYRTNAKCPRCGSEILNDRAISGCENLDCDVWFVGVPDDDWERFDPEREDTDA